MECRVVFERYNIWVYKRSTIIGQDWNSKGLYYLCAPEKHSTHSVTALVSNLFKLHEQLAHVNLDTIKETVRDSAASGVDVNVLDNMKTSESCAIVKASHNLSSEQRGREEK